MKRSDDRDDNDMADPSERIPAKSDYFRPDRFLLDEPEDEEPRDEKPVDVSQCPHRMQCMGDALRLLSNQMSARDALIFIARFYYRLKLKDIEAIFRLDLTNIWRVAQEAERKLKVRG